MKTYGYARVSTMKQSIERQIRNIKAAHPDAVIITDEYTGTKMDRPGWQKVYKAAKAGDMIVFDSVSRMSRDAEEGFKVYQELYARGVDLVFIKEPYINTTSYKAALSKTVNITVSSGDQATDEMLSGMLACINKFIMVKAGDDFKKAFEQAEQEVEDLRQRTREGLETARLNGKHLGQMTGAKLTTKKSIAAKEQIKKHSRDFGGTLDDSEVMKLTGIARGTYYKYKRELKEE